MNRNFRDILWLSFKKVQGPLSSSGGFIAAIILWAFKPDASISLSLAIPIAVIFCVINLTLYDAALESFNLSKKILPSVLYAKRENSDMLFCLLEPSELFSQDILVSLFFRNDEDFEIFLGIGTVRNIQSDGKIQVEILRFQDEYKDIFERLANNENGIMKRIYFKPVITKSYYDTG